jgi:hypothetical protein
MKNYIRGVAFNAKAKGFAALTSFLMQYARKNVAQRKEIL